MINDKIEIYFYNEFKDKDLSENIKLDEVIHQYKEKYYKMICNSIHFDIEKIKKEIETDLSKYEYIDLNNKYFSNRKEWKNKHSDSKADKLSDFINNDEYKWLFYFMKFDELDKIFTKLYPEKINEEEINYDISDKSDNLIVPIGEMECSRTVNINENHNSDIDNNHRRSLMKERRINEKNLEKIGTRGELVAYNSLKAIYGEDNVKWVSQYAKEKNVNRNGKDGLGYDIDYIDENGNTKYVEVKTSEKSGISEFYLSYNEYRFAEANSSAYELYFVQISDNPEEIQCKKLTNFIDKGKINVSDYKIVPVQYKVSIGDVNEINNIE